VDFRVANNPISREIEVEGLEKWWYFAIEWKGRKVVGSL
jgi:hypothetical protein